MTIIVIIFVQNQSANADHSSVAPAEPARHPKMQHAVVVRCFVSTSDDDHRPVSSVCAVRPPVLEAVSSETKQETRYEMGILPKLTADDLPD